MSIVQKCITLALAQSVFASVQDHASTFTLQGTSADLSSSYASTYADSDRSYGYSYSDFDYSWINDSYSYYSEPTTGEKIKDALSEAADEFKNKYVDEEAIEEWLQEQEELATEIHGRHAEENEAFASDVRDDIEAVLPEVEQWVEEQRTVAEEISTRQDSEWEALRSDAQADVELAIEDTVNQIRDDFEAAIS